MSKEKNALHLEDGFEDGLWLGVFIGMEDLDVVFAHVGCPFFFLVLVVPSVCILIELYGTHKLTVRTEHGYVQPIYRDRVLSLNGVTELP